MKVKILSLFALTMMIVGSLALIPSIPVTVGQEMTTVPEMPVDVLDAVQKAIAEDNPSFPSDFNIDDLLGDRDNNYQTIYEPWKSKAAIHSIAYDTETGFLACGGGYL